MRAGNAVFLLRQHWRFHWASWAVVALLVCVGAFIVTLIGGTTRALAAAMREWSKDVFPPTVLTIRPQTQDIGLFGFHLAVPQATITAATLAQVEAMPEVQRLFPVQVIPFPTFAEATFMGNGFGTDAVVAGIDPELVRSEVASAERFAAVDWRSGERVPVLLSSYFLDLYNLMYARTINAPALSERTVIGFEFDLSLGESVLGGSLARGPARSVRCRIVGLTRNPQLLGITIPRQTAEEFHRWHAEATGASGEMTSAYAFAEVSTVDEIAPLQARLDPLHLTAESPSHMDRVSTVERLLRIASAALQMIILGLTLFASGCLMVLQMEHRRPSLVFLHVSGVPAPAIYGLLLGEAAGVVVTAAALGAWAAMTLLNGALARLAAVLPVSLPSPQLGLIESLLVASVSVVLLAGSVTLVALLMLAAQHRRVGRRPFG